MTIIKAREVNRGFLPSPVFRWDQWYRWYSTGFAAAEVVPAGGTGVRQVRLPLPIGHGGPTGPTDQYHHNQPDVPAVPPVPPVPRLERSSSHNNKNACNKARRECSARPTAAGLNITPPEPHVANRERRAVVSRQKLMVGPGLRAKAGERARLILEGVSGELKRHVRRATERGRVLWCRSASGWIAAGGF
jgi:hypothetical protein